MIKFRAKQFSSNEIVTGALKGATLGGAISNVGLLGALRKRNLNLNNSLKFVGGGILIGAALGALVGAIREENKYNNRINTVDDRLMKGIIKDLKSKNYVEGKDFTRDPKQADDLRTKISIVVSQPSGELNLLVNSVDDPKLNKLITNITKTIPNASARTKKVSDKFNELTLTTITNTSIESVGLVANIVEQFIRNGYPVYLVEVG